MIVGICKLTFRMPEGISLKHKRNVIRSISSQVRNRFNVAIAEVDNTDVLKEVTLGFSCLSNNVRHVDKVMSNVVKHVQEMRPDIELIDIYSEVLTGI